MLYSFSSLCDDLYYDMYVNTELDLPTSRDTILSFFERIQRHFPTMNTFSRREEQEYCLEESRDTGHYRWVAIEKDRIASGVVNPDRLEEVYRQHKLVLEVMPYMLGVSHLDIHSLDVTFVMDFDYSGNHDEIIAEALFGATAFTCLLDLPSARPINFSPVVVVALSDDCRTQARISVESKTNITDPGRKEQVDDEAISLAFTIRQYPTGVGKFDALSSFECQSRLAEQLMAEKIIPNFVYPLTNAIAQRRLT